MEGYSLHTVIHMLNMLEGLNQGSQMLILTLLLSSICKYTKDLGIMNVAEFLYRIPHMELHNGLFPLKEDGDVSNVLIKCYIIAMPLVYMYMNYILVIY